MGSCPERGGRAILLTRADMTISRRALLTGSLTLAASLIGRPGAAVAKPAVTVYKSPT